MEIAVRDRDPYDGGRATIAAYIDEIIMFCAGLWMTSVGFGYLPLPGYSANPPLVRHFKWMGPILLVIAIVLAAAS
ncbi:hypothetical protein RJJ37_04395 [Rhizobium redzepovicii]|uniref:Uncharacterized protein n=1 Tax=Rhizobium redzepovicii TaxID=2867518 RepID=A0AAW8NY40_9HYPH|nr:hypothetical protein [Rhizobium redzepovicii]MDR9758880.1 hypothetical protein [Rhizobium redzepovicii]